MKKIKLKDVNGVLPIGLKLGGIAHSNFSFKPLTYSVEREMARVLEDSDTNTSAIGVDALLSVCLDEFAGVKNTSEDHRKTISNSLKQSYYADVMTMYLSLRLQEIGPEFYMNGYCPICNKPSSLVGDVGETGIDVPDDEKDLYREYKLIEPLPFRGNATMTSLQIGPNIWGTSYQGIDRFSDVKRRAILGAIRNVNGVEKSLIENDILAMRKKDMNALVNLIGEVNFGPEMVIGLKCGSCKKYETVEAFDWRYTFFFDLSSRS